MLTKSEAWKFRISWLWRVFSISDLFSTLLSPWHRDRTQKGEGFTWYERILLNTVVRIIGMVFRLAIIIPGLLLIVLVTIAYPAYILLPIKIDVKKSNAVRALGRDLAFGFTPNLKQHARELGHHGETWLVGKDTAQQQLERVLAKPNQNNVLLVGPPGTGRSILIDQLAYKLSIGQSDYPGLQYRHVWEIQTESLSEPELQEIIIESANAGNIILVIDNFHAYPTLPDILLPYLELSNLQIIGITDPESYNAGLKQRSDLLQAFEKVEIAEPDDSEVAALLAAMVSAAGHQVENERVTSEIVRITNQLEPYQSQPQKSISLLEQLLNSSVEVITLAEVYKIESQRSGVKVGGVDDAERKVLLNMEQLLSDKIIGQRKAVSAIANALRRSRAGVADANKPVGSFLFLGPTGVGKTHTAKTLSGVYFGAEEPLFRIDMSEFRDLNSIINFIDRVASMIEENPNTVALFDEIEKAHPDVLNLFLQILDEGFITNTTGRKSYFNNAIIIATSNIASELLLDNTQVTVDELVQFAIRNYGLKPEFINRFDQVIAFEPLDNKSASTVARLMLFDLAESVYQQKGIILKFDEELIVRLSAMNKTSKFGARAIKRQLQDSVQNFIALRILETDLKAGDELVVTAVALDNI